MNKDKHRYLEGTGSNGTVGSLKNKQTTDWNENVAIGMCVDGTSARVHKAAPIIGSQNGNAPGDKLGGK